jgi:hypothetical protein
MSLVLQSSGGGSVTLAEPVTASNYTITLPAVTGTMLTTASAGAVLQVVQTVKTDFFSLGTTGTWTDVTGASVTITPTSASNKVLVMFAGEYGGQSTDGFAYLRVVRNSTTLSVGDARGSSRQVTMSAALRNGGGNSSDISRSFGCQILDTPSTASAVTYKLQMLGTNNPSFCIGGSFSSADGNRSSVPTFITAMEISA